MVNEGVAGADEACRHALRTRHERDGSAAITCARMYVITRCSTKRIPLKRGSVRG